LKNANAANPAPATSIPHLGPSAAPSGANFNSYTSVNSSMTAMPPPPLPSSHNIGNSIDKGDPVGSATLSRTSNELGYSAQFNNTPKYREGGYSAMYNNGTQGVQVSVSSPSRQPPEIPIQRMNNISNNNAASYKDTYETGPYSNRNTSGYIDRNGGYSQSSNNINNMYNF
jgi:hypothetical protein